MALNISPVRDTKWLTLEVCRQFQRGNCSRSDEECKFAHPPKSCQVENGRVIACFDSLKVRSVTHTASSGTSWWSFIKRGKIVLLLKGNFKCIFLPTVILYYSECKFWWQRKEITLSYICQCQVLVRCRSLRKYSLTFCLISNRADLHSQSFTFAPVFVLLEVIPLFFPTKVWNTCQTLLCQPVGLQPGYSSVCSVALNDTRAALIHSHKFTITPQCSFAPRIMLSHCLISWL